jgi:hypothetical protein
MLSETGYLGEALAEILVGPVSSVLYLDRGTMPFIRYASGVRRPWPLVIPKMPSEPGSGLFKAVVSTNFHTRTEELSTVVADLLNQILRDMQYGADLAQLKQHTQTLAAVPLVKARQADSA